MNPSFLDEIRTYWGHVDRQAFDNLDDKARDQILAYCRYGRVKRQEGEE